MPILPAEPELHPPDLWAATSAPIPGRRWWCLHTRPRQEKTLARRFRSLGLGHFLPQVERLGRTPGGRATRSLVPLFPGYVFAHCEPQRLIDTRVQAALANVLPVHDQVRLRADLMQVHELLTSGLAVQAEPVHPPGCVVRIQTGPLQGLVGTVLRRQGQADRFVAIVRLLGQGVSVQLHDWQVEAIESGPAPGESPDRSPGERAAWSSGRDPE